MGHLPGFTPSKATKFDQQEARVLGVSGKVSECYCNMGKQYQDLRQTIELDIAAISIQLLGFEMVNLLAQIAN
jgi:hypothetical protein